MIKLKLIGLLVIAIAFTMCCESPSNNSSGTTTTTTTTTTTKSDVAIVELDDPDGVIDIASNFYFVFDVSGSMNNGCSGSTKIKGAQNALLNFIEKVPSDANIGLMLFGVGSNGHQVKEVLALAPYNDNKAEFIRLINKLQAGGSTPLATATKEATKKLIAQYKRQLTYGEYRMIIVSDGEANDNGNYRKALKYATKYPFISIYGISLCLGGNNILADYAVSFIDANDYEELEKALEESVSELPTFDPTDFDFDELAAEFNN